MVDGQAGSLQHPGVLRRRPGRRGHELDALVDHELGDRRITHECLGDFDAEGPIGELADLAVVVLHCVAFARRRLDDPARFRLRHRRCELRSCDPSHRCLDGRDVDAEVTTHPVVQRRGKWWCHLAIMAARSESFTSRTVATNPLRTGRSATVIPGWAALRRVLRGIQLARGVARCSDVGIATPRRSRPTAGVRLR